jgi:hypothetical protein
VPVPKGVLRLPSSALAGALELFELVLLVATQPLRLSAVPAAAVLQLLPEGTVVDVVLVLVVDELVLVGTVVVVVGKGCLCTRTRTHLHR